MIGFFNIKRFKKEVIYAMFLFIGFIFLGNKNIMYHAYLLPFTFMIFMSYVLGIIRERKKIILLISVFVVFFIIELAQIYKITKHNNATYGLLKDIYSEVPLGSNIYTLLRLEPYLSKDYVYSTTTHKDKINAYSKYNINLHNTYVVVFKGDGILNYIKQKNYNVRSLKENSNEFLFIE